MYEMKSLFQPLKLRFQEHWTTLFHTRFLLGSYLDLTWFLSLMTASKRPLHTVLPKNYCICIIIKYFLVTLLVDYGDFQRPLPDKGLLPPGPCWRPPRRPGSAPGPDTPGPSAPAWAALSQPRSRPCLRTCRPCSARRSKQEN
jgi:hypothetical protein